MPETFLERYVKNHEVLKTIDEVKRSKESLLLRTLADKLSGSASLLEGFNNWCDNVFEEQIISKSFTASDGCEIRFKNPKLNKPEIIIDGKKEILFPHYCRENSVPYLGIMTVVCEVTKPNSEKITTSLELGRIPIMIGSKKCNLYGKTEEELVELNECISDPFGYFILKSERSVITQDKKRTKIPFILLEKNGKLVCDIISGDKGKTKQFNLTTGKKWTTLKINDNYGKNYSSDKKNIPVFVVFKLLENIGPVESIRNYILKFFPQKYKKKAVHFLNMTVIKMKNIPDIIQYLCRKRKKKFSYEKKEEFREEFRAEMIENFLPDVTSETESLSVSLKLNMFGYLISLYILTALNAIGYTSRDSWINKRFDSAGPSIEILLTQSLNSIISVCKRDISKNSENPDFSGFGNSLRSKSSAYVTRDFQRSFNTDSWGSQNMYQKPKKQHAGATPRATPIAIWSESVKTNNSSSRRGKSFDLREVHPSQRDKTCVIETPEGQHIGMVKFAAMTNRYSLDTDERESIRYAKNFMGNYNDVKNGKKCETVVILNGRFISYEEMDIEFCYCTEDAFRHLKKGKTTGKIDFGTEITHNEFMNCIEIYTDESRPTSPYLVVNDETKNLVIEEIGGWGMEYKALLKSGAIEFLSAKECDNEKTLICYSVQKFKEDKLKISGLTGKEKSDFMSIRNYTHCNVDPIQLLSVSAACAPLINRQMGPRSTYQAAMIKQALGYFNINYHSKFYGKKEGMKRLFRGTRCFTETDAYFLPKLDVMPSGQTANVAFLSDPDNQEDAVIVSEDFVNSGNLNYIKYVSVFYAQLPLDIGTTEILQKPEVDNEKEATKYINIGSNGLPKLDSYIKEGDCIIGKVLKTKEGKIINKSQFTTMGEKGYVDRIIKTREKENGNLLIKIKLRQYRKYIAGDKLAIRYAQKGTVGRVDKRENMIRVSDGHNKGIVPDVIFNPHGFPSRQTCGLLLEGLLTKGALFTGERVDFTGFREIDIEKAKDALEKNGYDRDGYENMEYPNGKKLKNKVFFTPLYEQVLKHQVMDKIQMRSNGKKSLYTHQPRGGRAQGGGQKVGEMEKDAFVSHGASGVILERMMKVSDEFKLIICQSCGSTINKRVCTVCDESKPGILVIPYVFKLLINLLNGVGIDIRINTEMDTISED